ncbi:MAG: DUF5662 family protein [Bacillota bacterium]|nr:DUF5662 family protein [Bacillota bacterium]
MSGFFGHLRTVNRHRRQVRKNCFRAGLIWQGLTHDLSKYSPSEFITGAKYYQGSRSPNEREREIFGASKAWMHHKGRNKHHFEYWIDINPNTKNYEPVRMPIKYVGEMFCDRVAASKIYYGSNYTDATPLAYYSRGQDRTRLHKETREILEDLLNTLANEGETAVFEKLKKLIKEDKKCIKKKH